ncbi:MAG TPA: hypothetical protein VFN23_15390 [Ktedonobacteraceae bacterium]|nr:hypothetical protein [Ktedonobacteraceae bacterium]
MRNRVPWIIACSLLLYRWLLTLAPDEFSYEYADPALQVFRQCCWEAYHKQGICGVLRLWLPTFADALYGILAEQVTMLKQVLCPRLAWPVLLALSCVLFPFYWLSSAWVPFGYLFHFIFAMPQAYIAGHIVLFCVTGLIMLFSMPALRKHSQFYILCLMLGAFAEEMIQILFNAHPGLHKDARNLLLDLCGILLASLLLRVWQGWGQRFFDKNMSGTSL